MTTQPNQSQAEAAASSGNGKKTSMGKKIALFLLFILAGIIVLYFMRTPSTTKYDKLDEASYDNFTKNTSAELNVVVDQNIDGFLEDLTSFTSLFKSVTDFLHLTDNSKERYVSEVWDKHFNTPIRNVVDSRVSMLVEDMYGNNQRCISDLRSAGVNVQGFERKIRDDLINSMSRKGITISSKGVDKSTINSAVALAAGTTAASFASLFKTNVYTAALGIIIDIAVTGAVEHKLNGELKSDLKKQIHAALHESLDGPNGLYARIKSGIDEFHAMRAEEIRKSGKLISMNDVDKASFKRNSAFA